MIRISPGPSLHTLEPRRLLVGCSLNTIFCGPTNTHNPLFAAASAVIKDWGRGSRKWAQTPSVNPVCACGRRAKKIKMKLKVPHRWTLACTCVFCLFLCVFLHRKGRRTAGRLFTGLRRRTRPLGYTGSHVAGKGKKTGTKQNKKQLEL